MPEHSRSRNAYGYDIFISHNRADKGWVRALADRLAAEQYNGRLLRPWLDEKYLDPGGLAGESELTTAMDRSRVLGLVLSPEAVAAKWVDFEVRYFLGTRDTTAVVPMLRRVCAVPPALDGLPILDFQDDAQYEEHLRGLVVKLCPPSAVDVSAVEQGVDAAFERVATSDPGGFSPDPTAERDAFFGELMLYDVDDLAAEGLAIAAFRRAAEHLLAISAGRSDAAYNYKMLLGECLAAALLRRTGYRQVSQRFLDLAEQSDDQSLLFVVSRAYSKLAERDVRLIDTSALLRVIALLDAKEQRGNEERALEVLLGRTVGKIRDTPAGELLVKTLSEGGRTSKIVAIVAISFSHEHSSPVFYLSELERWRAKDAQPGVGLAAKNLLSLLFDFELDDDAAVRSALGVAKGDIEQAFPGTDLPYPYLWPGLRRDMTATNLHNGPFMGSVVKVTRQNMIELAHDVSVSNIACLTEPRIVDALFGSCGALLILEQEPDSPQCRRLRSRAVPFAMLSAEAMSELNDGDPIMVDHQRVSIWRGSRITPSKGR